MKHPYYTNDYSCHTSINPKKFININNISNIQKNIKENIIIIINNIGYNFKEIKKSIIYLLKSIPENIKFNIFFNSPQPIYNENIQIKENNINNIIDKIEQLPEKIYDNDNLLEILKFIKFKKEKNTKIFLVDRFFSEI